MPPPAAEWTDVVVRCFILGVLGLTTGLCLGQALWRRRLRRFALSAYAAVAGAASYSQLSLLDAPLTQRTYPFLFAAVVQIVYWVVLFRGRSDDVEFPDLPDSTRELIRRHPELLTEFAAWREDNNPHQEHPSREGDLREQG